MIVSEKMLSIAGICVRTECELPFSLSERCVPFLVSEGTPDITMTILDGGTLPEFSSQAHVFSLEDEDIFQKDGMTIKVKYANRRKENINWYLIYRQSEPSHYELHILEAKRDYTSINPLAYVDLSSFLMRFGAMVLHSSLVDHQGSGIIFTAPSGTGKSTQADLWERYRNAEILNGDRSILRKSGGVYRAYGSPYAGSSDIYKNKSVPATAIVVLRQAKENKLRKLAGREAYLCLVSQISISSWNRETVEQQTLQILDLLNSVPVYMLECLPDEGAVDLLYRELRNQVE